MAFVLVVLVGVLVMVMVGVVTALALRALTGPVFAIYPGSVSMLAVSIPERFAVRGDPRSESCTQIGFGELNKAGFPYPVRVYSDGESVFLVQQRRWTIGAYPSYVLPRSEIETAQVTGRAATIHLKGGASIVLGNFSGLSFAEDLSRGSTSAT